VAKPIRKQVRKTDQKHRSLSSEPLPLSRQNYLILAAGIVVIVAGYLAMLEGSVEGFLPLVLSPILLVAGYCVIIPIGIMYRKAAPKEPVPAVHPEAPKEA
jgi:NAD/NADP transhydrogenase beta subunit